MTVSVTESLMVAKKAKGLSFADLESAMGLDEVWIASLFYGQATASKEEAEKLAGLLSLPKEPFLAAAIDGASTFRKFVYVTFPLMAPISIGAIIIRLIEASKIMDTVFVLTSGGPGTATETSSFYIYIKGLREFQMGYAATLSFTYLVIMIISLTIIAKVLTKLMIKE